jgi:hypothetical protein
MSAAQAPAGFPSAAGLRLKARQGSDNLAAALKIISDLSAQELALVIGLLRERISLKPSAETVKTAGKLVDGSAEAGKVMLDLVEGESAIAVESLKQALALRPELGAMADLVPRGLETLLDMHKRLLETVAGQAREVAEAYSAGKPLRPVSRAAKVTREAIEGFVEAQKAFLDQVNQQVTIAVEGKGTRGGSKGLLELARDGVDKFIAAQKKMTQLAFEQIGAVTDRPRPKVGPKISLADLARESVQNFTAAQKSLLDLAIQPIAVPEPPVAPAVKRRAKPRKRAAAANA